MAGSDAQRWPALRTADWKKTRDTLHLWTQVVGKIRLALTPWLNHSWHVALYVTARGLTTSPIFVDAGSFQIDFDFIDHALRITTSDGDGRTIALRPMTVADFYAQTMAALKQLNVTVHLRTMPCEIADCIPFELDTIHAAYDADYVNRFWRVLITASEVLGHFRTGFIGKASPVHFFWGSFDLAVTRFSGRRAPRHPGGMPHVRDAVAQEAYSHEVSSAGFWPGGGPIDYAAFYSYAYPAPEGFAAATVKPAAALFSKEMGEFLLPYEAVRSAPNPDAALMEFLQSTYEAAANLAKWDRGALECELGEPNRVRPV